LEDKRLAGKAAIVTGATKGIGRAIALKLAGAGASVLGLARDISNADELVAQIGALGAKAHFISADVSKWEDCQRAVSAALEVFGRLDILVNNAGTSLPHLPISQIAEADWRKVTGVTLDGTAFMSRSALPHMIGSKDGVIVNIASTAGVQTGAAMGAYAAAKAGVIQLTKVIAVENVANNVRANALLVGATDTDLVHKAFAEFSPDGAEGDDRAAEALGPLLLKPEGVAGAVLMLCSDDAREINGAAITVDRALLAGLGHTMLMERMLADR